MAATVEVPEYETPVWRRFGFILFAVVLAIAYLPLLSRLGSWLWNRDHYSFFPLALLAGVALLIYAVANQHNQREPSAVVRRMILALALTLLFVSVLLASPWLGGLSAMVMLLAVLFTLGGSSLVRQALPTWVLLWLIIPIPLSYDRELILGMRHFATRLSSGLLDLMGYVHVVDGVVIRLQERVYQIEEACSGIQSLFSILFCVGLYAVVTRAHFLRASALLTFAVYAVMVANIGRIVAVVVLRERWGLPFDQGFLHQLLGVIAFGITLLFVYSFDRFLTYLWPPSVAISGESIDPSQKPSAEGKPDKSPQRLTWFGRREVIVASAVLAVLAVVQLMSMTMGGSMALNTESRAVIPFLQQDGEDQLPAKLGEWQRVGYRSIERDSNDINGKLSRLWIYEKDGMQVEASVDGPFLMGWHYLTFCYQSRGWQDSRVAYRNYRDQGYDIGGDYIQFDVVNADEHGCVVFGYFDKDFRAFVAPRVEKMQRHFGRIVDFKLLIAQLFGYGDDTIARSNSVSCQIQIFHHGPLALEGDSRQNCEEFFLLFREAVASTAGEKE